MALHSSYASPITSDLDDLVEYIDEPFITPVQSSNTPSPVSSPSILSPTDISGNWSNMSFISRSRTATVVSDLEVELTIARHPVYYIPSGDVTFLAGEHLFRVHRYFFVRESVKFRDMLSVVTSNGTELMGASDSQPILLSDVSSKEFEEFLWIYYNDEYEYEAPLEKWTAILRLAHMWQFPKVKALAMRKMDKLDIEPVDKAVIARTYQVDMSFGWLEQAYAAIGAREESISKAEAVRLGLDIVVRLAELRERIQKRKFHKEKSVLQLGQQVIRPGRPLSPEPSWMRRGDCWENRSASRPPSRYSTRPPSPTRSFVGLPKSPACSIVDLPKSPVRSFVEAPFSDQPGVPQAVPILQKTTVGYTKEDLADVRFVFGI